MAFALAGLTALFYGSSHFAGALATRRASVLAVTFWANAVGLVLAVCAAVVHHIVVGDTVTFTDQAWSALCGVAGVVGVAFYLQGLAKGQMAVVAPVSAVTQAIVPFLFSVAVGEHHTVSAWVGVLLAIPALWLTVHRQKEQGRPGRAWYGLAAGLAFSLFFVAITQTSPEAGFWPLVTLRVSGLVLLGIFFLARRAAPAVPSEARPMALLSGGYILANLTYLLATRIGPFGLVTVTASFYPVVTSLLAAVVVKEKIPLQRMAGMALSVVSLALITI